MKIVLVGYMASGKSTVGRLLARQLDATFIDLDEYIEEHQQKSIKSIFSEKGEIYFRQLEHEMLLQVLENEEHLVLSTGGGTPCYGNNMTTILQESDHSIYLNLSIPNLVDRISKEKENRPLVKNIPDTELPEFVGKHLFERSPFYLKAKHVLDCNSLGVETVVGEVKKLL
ncbi:shikimate kinase [Allomuricauda sp. F6463D]|uniref:shikimate kinase n=1 Tax=Allomuricauda sp. F6463D TaxID=2926409 RepID=UPI001FF4E611|nr:shikimate kinase [Muricauda sp. F6463D]MCK0162129.1 shikimate kinase [Muricauda sp. F6463D]